MNGQEVAEVTQICALYELWDWQERQAKAVVNGQRLYEYFGLDWALPYWDKPLVEFWMRMPLKFRLNQYLHIKYLEMYNYRNAFSNLRSVNQVWPSSWRWITTVGRVIELFSSYQRKQDYFERMFYFSYFRNQLGLFGYEAYCKYYKQTRRPRVVPIAAIQHLSEMGISTAEYL